MKRSWTWKGKKKMSHGTNVELALRDLAIEIEKLQAERNGWKTIAHCSHCEPQHDYFCTKHRVEEE